MKKIFFTLLLFSLSAAGFAQKQKTTSEKVDVAKPPKSQTKTTGADEAGHSLSADKKQHAWMEAMTPGEEHEHLLKAAGEWKEEITMWSAAGAAPTVNSASCQIKMIMDGRYQESTHNGDFDGVTFQGTGITGYDRVLRKYVSTWIDNMGTGIMYSSGVMNEKLGAIEFFGVQADPVSGKMIKVRELYYEREENEIMIEMYNTPPGGKEFKSMEIRMTR